MPLLRQGGRPAGGDGDDPGTMIFRLIQFKKTPYGVHVVVLCFAVLFALWEGPASLRGLAIVPGVWGINLFLGRANRFDRVSRFGAALPIRARDWYAATMLEDIPLECLMLVVIAAAIVMSRSVPAGIVITVACEVGALLSVARILELSVAAARVTTPKLTGRLIGGGMNLMSCFFLTWQVPPRHGDPLYVPTSVTVCIVAGCVVFGGFVFWKTWSSMPDALQLAPAEPMVEHRDRKPLLPSFSWQPLVRALFGAKSAIAAMVLLGCGIFGPELPRAEIIAIAACWFAIWLKLSVLRARSPWIFALPVSRQRIFLAVAALPLGMFAAGSAIHFLDAPQSAGAIVSGFAMAATAALLPGLFIGTPSFARNRRVQWAYVRIAAILGMMGVLVWAVCGVLSPAAVPNRNWLGVFVLARSAWSAVASLALLATAYWLGSRGFSRMETRPVRGIAACGLSRGGQGRL